VLLLLSAPAAAAVAAGWLALAALKALQLIPTVYEGCMLSAVLLLLLLLQGLAAGWPE
jgi:hypothetical protein